MERCQHGCMLLMWNRWRKRNNEVITIWVHHIFLEHFSFCKAGNSQIDSLRFLQKIQVDCLSIITVHVNRKSNHFVKLIHLLFDLMLCEANRQGFIQSQPKCTCSVPNVSFSVSFPLADSDSPRHCNRNVYKHQKIVEWVAKHNK